MSDEILTLREVAEYLKIGERTVYRLVQGGGLPGFKVGGAWRFQKALLDQWIAEKSSAGTQNTSVQLNPKTPTKTGR